MKKMKKLLMILAGCAWLMLPSTGTAAGGNLPNLDEWRYAAPSGPMENAVVGSDQFNGYLNLWANEYWKWIRFGNLFQLSVTDPENSIAQCKRDLAEELGVVGLNMEEGFLDGLMSGSYRILRDPPAGDLLKALSGGSVLVAADSRTPLGRMLEGKLPAVDEWRVKLRSVQYNRKDFVPMHAFYLENGTGGKRLYVISSPSTEARERMQALVQGVADVLARYQLHRGWFGAQTMFYSVTCFPGHPLEIIGKSMNQGNDFITFSGYMDYMLQKDLPGWLEKVKLPFVADVGVGNSLRTPSSTMYGCRNYDGIAPQDTSLEADWIRIAHDRQGYIFRPVYADELNAFRYDGNIAIEGNKEQIDNENTPFIMQAGFAKETIPPCMVLFVPRGEPLTKERMYEAILARRNVAVFNQAQMMGAKPFRSALQMLLLDRVSLEEYFADRIQIRADVHDYNLVVSVDNTYSHPVSGSLAVTVPPEIGLKTALETAMILPANSSRTLTIPLQPSLAAMNQDNPVAVHFRWGNREKGTLTVLQLPPTISIHRLLYGHAPVVAFPVTVHNFGPQAEFPVRVDVVDTDRPGRTVFRVTERFSVPTGNFQTRLIPLRLPPGRFKVNVAALGDRSSGQLGMGEKTGSPRLTQVDLNHDGINEYQMENGRVRVTLLRIGARVIEYIVKERNDNIFFKLWPEKEDSDRRPFRKRGFYPYGGFEDFLGQASMETHQLYDAEVIRTSGDFVQVKMSADYYGNKLEKIFTLYGDSPLLEVRFALTFRNPEANVIGPQPILELGEKHGPEDQFFVPTRDGIKEFRMRPGEYYGRVFDLAEGWNAGYESKEDTTFIGAFPVSQPHFLHMWMNHPVNSESHHYYAEFQPWVPIFQKSTMYFSYYIWGAPGPWENGLKILRGMNLITKK